MEAGIRKVTVDDEGAVALTLAKAFHDDPVMAILFGGSVPQPAATRFFARMAHMQIPHGEVYATSGNEAAAVWAPPGRWKVPNVEIAKNTPAFLRIFGLRFVANLSILMLLEKNHPEEPHYYLEFLGTDPAHQGHGLGSALMQPMIDRCDREGLGAYLESSKEANLGFYGRFGFEVTKIINHKAGVPQWLMWRDPR